MDIASVRDGLGVSVPDLKTSNFSIFDGLQVDTQSRTDEFKRMITKNTYLGHILHSRTCNENTIHLFTTIEG